MDINGKVVAITGGAQGLGFSRWPGLFAEGRVREA